MKKLLLCAVLFSISCNIFAQEKEGDYITFNLKSGEKIKTHEASILKDLEKNDVFEVNNRNINKVDISSIIYNKYENGDLIKREYKVYRIDADKNLLCNVILKTNNYFLAYKKTKTISEEDNVIVNVNYFILDKSKKTICTFSSNADAQIQLTKYFSEQEEWLNFLKKQKWNLKKCNNSLLKVASFLYVDELYKEEPLDNNNVSNCLKKLIDNPDESSDDEQEPIKKKKKVASKDDEQEVDESVHKKKSKEIVNDDEDDLGTPAKKKEPKKEGLFNLPPSLDLATGFSTYFLTPTLTTVSSTSYNTYYPQKVGITLNIGLNFPIKTFDDIASIGASSGIIYSKVISSTDAFHFFRCPILFNAKLGGDAVEECEKKFGIGVAIGPAINFIHWGVENFSAIDFVVAPEIMINPEHDGSIILKLKDYITLAGKKTISYTDLYHVTQTYDFRTGGALVFGVTLVF